MIDVPDNPINNDKENKRRGFMFAPRVNSLNVKDQITLKNQVVLRNRQSDIATSNNVFEIFTTKPTPNGENYMFLGRFGKDFDGSLGTRNVNYIELTADANTNAAATPQNGQCTLRMSVNGVPQNQSLVGLQHGALFATNGTGVRAFLNGQGDASSDDMGGAQMTYSVNGQILYAVEVSKAGIQMTGLPTSASGLSSGAIWRDGTTLRIVA